MHTDTHIYLYAWVHFKIKNLKHFAAVRVRVLVRFILKAFLIAGATAPPDVPFNLRRNEPLLRDTPVRPISNKK